MTDAGDPQSYVLSESESAAIFERDIVPAELGALVAPTEASTGDADAPATTRTPLAVLLVGQTGAGKTRTAPAIKRAVSHLRGRPLHFIADTYKAYHPAYQTLLQQRNSSSSLASAATSPDARRWLSMAAARAASARADVVLESAARHPGDFAALAALFAAAGYRVEAAVLAVPAPLSRLGVLARFYLDDDGAPQEGDAEGMVLLRLPAKRLTPRAVHDASYDGLLEAAAFVDKSDAFDQVVVVRRDGLVAHSDERLLVPGSDLPIRAWRRGPSAAAAVRTERERPLTRAERAVVESTLRRLRNVQAPGLEDQLAEVEELLAPLMGDPDGPGFPPLRLLSLPQSERDAEFDAEAGLRLGTVLL
ncbi:zeta toxin-domain-containing protein [Hypoxylon sp. FL1284]|nr:zeta toxin-domain-containing protein [Hypoxylon sp. FL1284]